LTLAPDPSFDLHPLGLHLYRAPNEASSALIQVGVDILFTAILPSRLFEHEIVPDIDAMAVFSFTSWQHAAHCH
jgi:hypothetical protein